MAGDKDDHGGDSPKKPTRRLDRKQDTLVKERVKRPRKHRVIMHNDDYTPMEFVVHLLESIFHKTPAEATRIMLTVHTSGIGVAGVYSREIAETKATKSVRIARDQGYPLMVSSEPQ